MEEKNYRKLRAAFEATQPQVHDDFTERVMKRIEEQSSVHRSHHRRLQWVAAAACILILIGIGTVTLQEEVPTSELVAVNSQEGISAPELLAADSREGIPTPKLQSPNDQTTNSPNDQTTNSPNDQSPKRPNDQSPKRPNNQDTLGTGIWQRRENVETALRILNECEADIERSEQQVRNHIIETTFRATPQPANVILVSDENGDYEVQETKRIINI